MPLCNNNADNNQDYITKISGDGDGLKTVVKKTPKRVPVPSWRKFTAIPKTDDTMKMKLEVMIKEMTDERLVTSRNNGKEKSKIRKAESIAESTPTKVTKRKIAKTCRNVGKNTENLSLQATPRENMLSSLSVLTNCVQTRRDCAARIIYGRLLLNAWRLHRIRLASTNDSLKRRDDQVVQLQMQVDVLQTLRNSESCRKEDINKEYLQTKKKLDSIIEENYYLNTEVQKLKAIEHTLAEEKTEIAIKLQNTKNELKAVQTDLNTLKQKYEQEKEKCKKKMDEKRILQEKISKQENLINLQRDTIKNLETALKNTENNVESMRLLNESSRQECKDLLMQIKKEMEVNNSLETKLNQLVEQAEEKERKIENLQNQLDYFIKSYEELDHKNCCYQQNLLELSDRLVEERNRKWYFEMKNYALNSYSILQSLAYIMLPALTPLKY